MKLLKIVALPMQVVLLFVVPALMLVAVVSSLALVFKVLGNVSFYDVTTSAPMVMTSCIMYVIFIITMGEYMWGKN